MLKVCSRHTIQNSKKMVEQNTYKQKQITYFEKNKLKNGKKMKNEKNPKSRIPENKKK